MSSGNHEKNFASGPCSAEGDQILYQTHIALSPIISVLIDSRWQAAAGTGQVLERGRTHAGVRLIWSRDFPRIGLFTQVNDLSFCSTSSVPDI